jgi:uncharacterized membrane protein
MTNAAPPPGADEASGGLLQTVAHRPRLIAGALIMLATYVALLLAPLPMRESTRMLIAWNIGAAAYLGLIALMMAAPSANPRVEARPEDESQWVLLLLGVIAGTAALAAIIWDLGPIKNMQGIDKAEHLALVSLSILTAWTYIQVLFAIHYAGVYFGATGDGNRGGLEFPGTPNPGWTEFVYQAFVVGCTFASSDANVTSTRMRRICVTQGVVGFFFNTIVLALAINIAAGFF